MTKVKRRKCLTERNRDYKNAFFIVINTVMDAKDPNEARTFILQYLFSNVSVGYAKSLPSFTSFIPPINYGEQSS